MNEEMNDFNNVYEDFCLALRRANPVKTLLLEYKRIDEEIKFREEVITKMVRTFFLYCL